MSNELIWKLFVFDIGPCAKENLLKHKKREYIYIYIHTHTLEAFCVFNHTDDLRYNETFVFGWQYICPLRGLSTRAKELTAASRVMQNFSCELSTLVSGTAKCKQAKLLHAL